MMSLLQSHLSRPSRHPDLDTSIPALVVKMNHNGIQHSTLGITRSLGRLGVPVYAAIEDCFVPAAMSRFLAGTFVLEKRPCSSGMMLDRLRKFHEQLNRAAVLIPTDDLAAIFIAENANVLEKWFLFPRLPAELPRRLANKKDLYFLCRRIGTSCPNAEFPVRLEDVRAFIDRAQFPVVLKATEPTRRPDGTRSVTIAQTPHELESLYRQVLASGFTNLFLQEYIPESCSEDWVFHGYRNPTTGSVVCFTGKKLRSYPAFAGSTTLGVSAGNDALVRQAEQLLDAISYAGIMDIDYRFDRRDGQYKLLDFNPRIGANFRMFEDYGGVDVVRALHLDLSGRPVPSARLIENHTFIAEPYDLLASASYWRQGALTLRIWWQSLAGESRETAWFSWDDPAPFITMCIRLLGRAAMHGVLSGYARLAFVVTRAHGYVYRLGRSRRNINLAVWRRDHRRPPAVVSAEGRSHEHTGKA